MPDSRIVPCAAVVLLALGILRRVSAPDRIVPASGDCLVALVLAALAFGATVRPFTTAVFVASNLIYLATADRLKRSILREPASFADGSELLQVYLYPQFYVPFAGAAIVYGVTGVLLSAVACTFILEPPALHGWAALVCVSVSLLMAAGMTNNYRRAPHRAAHLAAHATGDLRADTSRFGSLGTIALHAWIAKSQRPALQKAAYCHLPRLSPKARHPPILLLQAESFFDVRRLAAEEHCVRLDHYDALCQRACAFGRLATPAWGGYTTRPEFAALTGLTRADIGLDWINPYHAFARVRLDSLPWRLHEAGYTTICVHPFDGRFYRRDIVMKHLGFDRLIDIKSFSGIARPDGTVDDVSLADAVNDLFDGADGPLFVFAITIANHGPWAPGGGPADELAAYSHAIDATDQMIGRLSAAPWASQSGALFGFYGDHMPILPRAYARWGEPDRRTDYALAVTGMAPGAEVERGAADWPRLILDLIEHQEIPDAPADFHRTRLPA